MPTKTEIRQRKANKKVSAKAAKSKAVKAEAQPEAPAATVTTEEVKSTITHQEGIVMVDPSKVVANDADNVRAFESDLTDLIQVIKSGNLQNPPTVYATVDQKSNEVTYHLVTGFRRRAAFIKVNENLKTKKLMPVRVVAEPKTHIDLLLLRTSENVDRKTMTWADKAKAASAIMTAGGKLEKVAKALRVATSMAGRIHSFMRLTPENFRLLHDEKLPFKLAEELAKVEDAKEQNKIAKEYLAETPATPKPGEKGKRSPKLPQADRAKAKQAREEAIAKAKGKATKAPQGRKADPTPAPSVKAPSLAQERKFWETLRDNRDEGFCHDLAAMVLAMKDGKDVDEAGDFGVELWDFLTELDEELTLAIGEAEE